MEGKGGSQELDNPASVPKSLRILVQAASTIAAYGWTLND
jgi:hypothetical protein